MIDNVNFNPRSLAGATTLASGTLDKGQNISIHAPSRERQQAAQSPLTQAAIFQSTLPRGSDSLRLAGVFKLRLFQSTLPRGSDVRL